ncbi:MAG: glycosyltransferase [Oscillospiraceae bacterium]|nr:glycosyltransferase [Oscillospiraceae bacterium]
MNMLFVAGGTAGHINPAVAVADYFKSQCKDANITFVGTPNGMESKLIPKAGYKSI